MAKKPKSDDKTARQIAVLQSELDEVRTRAEGWYQVAEQRQQKLDKQAALMDQKDTQIEGLRRALNEANAQIEALTGVKPAKRDGSPQIIHQPA